MADYTQLMNLEKKAPAPTFPPRNNATPISEPHIASLLAKKQTDKPANQQVSKTVNAQTSKPASIQTSLPVNQFTSKELKQQISKGTNQQTSDVNSQQTTKEKKKYGTYLREDSISAIQILAVQTKQKDHVVLQEIVDFYFTNKK